MAEAALVEEMQVPNGGIADFVMSDEDIDAVYGPDDDGAEEYGTEGLGQFTDVANQMAAKGRYGDDLVAHVESGELVIPKDFLDRDPELKRSLFKYLEDHGIENPERYVVGSKANSINPETGMPEFFFKKLKKAVKSVAKTVSKVAKPVVKIIQKAAPIVLPMALAATPLGPVFGAALGSGIASLINGGSIKDAFKQALVSGAMGAVYAGFGSMATPGGSFFGGVSDAVSNPMARLGQTLTGAQNSLTRLAGGEVAANAPGFFSDFVKPAASTGLGSVSQTVEDATKVAQIGEVSPSKAFAEAVPTGPELISNYPQTGGIDVGEAVGYGGSKFGPGQNTFDPTEFADNAFYNVNMPQPVNISNFQAPELTDAGFQQIAGGGQQIAGGGQQTTSFLDKAQDYGQQAVDFFKGESSLTPTEISKINADSAAAYIKDFNAANNTSYTFANAPASVQNAALASGKSAVAAAQPGFLAKYGPMALLGAGTLAVSEATGLTDFTKTPEQESPGLIRRDADGNIIDSGEYYIERDPSKYLVGDTTARYADYASYVDPTQYRYDIFNARSAPGGPFQRPDTFVADGGPIFPRRNGGIMPNEGTPGKDSVRAMLMPGEFVMTTDAVRGAGGGNLNQGINNMYTVMRNLESRGRRMA